jgi:PAS domain-containing protein
MFGVCAWCKSEILCATVDGVDDGRITHGICMVCVAREFADVGIPLTYYLDTLPAPVAVVDSEGVIQIVNQAAANLVGKPQVEAKGLLGGDVFGCVHAAQPEGCGKTIHCSACTIRNTVMETMRTGNLQNRIPARLSAGGQDDPEDYDLTITTEKSNGVVLLRIDAITPAAKTAALVTAG